MWLYHLCRVIQGDFMVVRFPSKEEKEKSVPQYACDSCKHFPPPNWSKWDFCLKGNYMRFSHSVLCDPHAFGYSPKSNECYSPKEKN